MRNTKKVIAATAAASNIASAMSRYNKGQQRQRRQQG